MNRLDHLVVGAASLTQGGDYLRELLGVEIPAGGVHRSMGTHNRLMQLGDDSYLELIAIDPAGTVPAQPRWFGLDQGLVRAALAERPRLLAWVINTPDLVKLAAATDFDIGTPTALSRDGLEWKIALTEDGRLLGGGMLPYCIQWISEPHPSRTMADCGCRLLRLSVRHNRPRWVAARLATLGASQLVDIEQIGDTESPRLVAEIDSPNGLVRLE